VQGAMLILTISNTFFSQRWFDGGFSDNLPIFETGKTIRVSPFCGDFDICPEDKDSYNLFTAEVVKNMHVVVNLQNLERGFRALFPPSKNDLQKIYKHGYNDALKFLGVFVSK
jgi:exonuclease III